jgi:hypothetical protein
MNSFLPPLMPARLVVEPFIPASVFGFTVLDALTAAMNSPTVQTRSGIVGFSLLGFHTFITAAQPSESKARYRLRARRAAASRFVVLRFIHSRRPACWRRTCHAGISTRRPPLAKARFWSLVFQNASCVFGLRVGGSAGVDVPLLFHFCGAELSICVPKSIFVIIRKSLPNTVNDNALTKITEQFRSRQQIDYGSEGLKFESSRVQSLSLRCLDGNQTHREKL